MVKQWEGLKNNAVDECVECDIKFEGTPGDVSRDKRLHNENVHGRK
jgi:hypothetical protein